MSRPRILFDCDPGVDDALALALAAAHTEVVGVTPVAGNVGLDRTVHNALALCERLGLDVPVVAGAHGPLVGERVDAVRIHGADGMGGAELDTRRSVTGDDAAAFLVDTIRATEGLWLVVTGPMTNVALALRRAPDIAHRIAGLSFMGGSRLAGNHTPVAEFNVWADPEAAAVVLSAGIDRVLMAGLDLTAQVPVDDAIVERLRAVGTPGTDFAARTMAGLLDALESLGVPRRGSMHDPCAVAAVTHPELFTHQHLPVGVELSGSLTRGMTVVDQRPFPRALTGDPNVEVGIGVDGEAVWDLIIEALAQRWVEPS